MNRMQELRVQRLSPLGCSACAYVDILTPSEELHHILIDGQRAGDWLTIFLCRGHHQGDHWHEHIPEQYRISIRDSRNSFAAAITDERTLWEIAQARLGLAWPTDSKIVPRRVVA